MADGPTPPAGRWVSTEDAARLLGVSVRTIRRRIDAGALTGERVEGSHALRVWIEGAAAEGGVGEPGEEPDAAEPAGQGSREQLPALPADPIAWALAEHLADLTHRNAELVQRIEHLAGEAATYRERLRLLEAQAAALPAGEAPPARPWWKRFLGID